MGVAGQHLTGARAGTVTMIWWACCASRCSVGLPDMRTSTMPTGWDVIPRMRWIVGGKAIVRDAASTSQMGRFETEWLANNENLTALTSLSGQWIDHVHGHRSPSSIVLDMDSSVSPTRGDQESTAYNGHFACTCFIRCS
jgi:hypothetical protein